MRIDSAPAAAGRALVAALLLAGCAPRSAPNQSRAAASNEAMWKRIGRELAMAAAAQPGLERVLILRQELKPEYNLGPGQDLMEAAFRSELQRRARPAPDMVTVSLPPMPPPDRLATTPYRGYREVTPSYLNDAVGKAGSVSLVASLLGPPTGLPSAGATWPAIVCFSPDGAAPLADLVRRHLVLAAVAPRHDNPARDDKDWFGLRYTVLTTVNLDAWERAAPAPGAGVAPPAGAGEGKR